jgi:hypothetical protein
VLGENKDMGIAWHAVGTTQDVVSAALQTCVSVALAFAAYPHTCCCLLLLLLLQMAAASLLTATTGA